eukprot:1015578-Prorocentrum_minimum.AAC.1
MRRRAGWSHSAGVTVGARSGRAAAPVAEALPPPKKKKNRRGSARDRAKAAELATAGEAAAGTSTTVADGREGRSATVADSGEGIRAGGAAEPSRGHQQRRSSRQVAPAKQAVGRGVSAPASRSSNDGAGDLKGLHERLANVLVVEVAAAAVDDEDAGTTRN